MKTGFARYVIKRLPVGFAASPFEFVFMLAYALISGKYLAEIALGTDPTDLASLSAVPLLRGDVLNAWLVTLLIGTICACMGLLAIGYRPILGLRLERSGLCAAGAMIAYYEFAVYNAIGFSFGIGFITIIGLLLATLYKIVLIGQALDALTERKGTVRT